MGRGVGRWLMFRDGEREFGSKGPKPQTQRRVVVGMLQELAEVRAQDRSSLSVALATKLPQRLTLLRGRGDETRDEGQETRERARGRD